MKNKIKILIGLSTLVILMMPLISAIPEPFQVSDDPSHELSIWMLNQKSLARSSDDELYATFIGNEGVSLYFANSTDDGETWEVQELFKLHPMAENDILYLNAILNIDTNDTLQLVFSGLSAWDEIEPQPEDYYTILAYSNSSTCDDSWDNWTEPIFIYNDSVEDIEILYGNMVMSIDSNDTLHLFTILEDNTTKYNHVIYTQSPTQDAAWAELLDLLNNTDYNASDITCGISLNDEIYSFFSDDSTGYPMMLKSENYGVAWSEPLSINETFTVDIILSMAIDLSGNILVVYQMTDIVQNLITVYSDDSGDTWKTNSTTAEDDFDTYPVTSVDADGTFHVLYINGDGNLSHITSTDGVNISSPEIIEDDAAMAQTIWSIFPVIDGLLTNMPQTGFATGYTDSSDYLWFNSSSDIEWGADAFPPAEGGIDWIFWIEVTFLVLFILALGILVTRKKGKKE